MSAPLALHLPSSTRKFVSRRFDETVNYVSHRLAPHRMWVSEPGCLATEIRAIALGPLDLIEIGYGADVRIAPAALEDFYMVHASVAGSSHVENGETHLTLDSENVHVLSPGQLAIFHMSRACRHVAVRIPAAFVERTLAQLIDGEVRLPLIFAPLSAPGSVLAGAWRRLLAHIVDQVRLAPEIVQNDATAEHYAGLLVNLLLDLQPSNYRERLSDRAPAICPRHVRRARSLIEQSTSETITIAELATAVEVSPRALQMGFRQFLGVTPGEYVRNQRLSRLHQALQAASRGASVTELMLASGITNFGRFSGYYRRRYGCTPSATLRRTAH